MRSRPAARRPRSTRCARRCCGPCSPSRRGSRPGARRSQVEGTPQAGLKPWREVVTPHPDVASGRYTEAEFAADLAQVQRGDAVAGVRRPGRVLPPHLPDRRPDPAARERAPATCRPAGRRSGDRAADQLRRRQDPLHARPVPRLRSRATRSAAGRGSDHGAGWGSRACRTSSGRCWSARRSRRARSGPAGGVETRTLWGELAWQLLGADGYTAGRGLGPKRRQPRLRPPA